MWGAIIGDIIGSRFEWDRIKSKAFDLFGPGCEYTDDSVCTAAVAQALLDGLPAAATAQAWCRRHPGRGYGGMFADWIDSEDPAPYGSFGNGAAMRVSPAAYLNRHRPLEDALRAADRVTAFTHDHPEGMKGARATAHAIWLACAGAPPSQIRRSIERTYRYDLSRNVDQIRPGYGFDETCQKGSSGGDHQRTRVDFLRGRDSERGLARRGLRHPCRDCRPDRGSTARGPGRPH